LSEIDVEAPHIRKSAVLMLLYPVEGVAHTVFIVRPMYDGVHSGQVAFPGGRQEETDADLKHTALRESKEEVGLSSENIEILGTLSSLYIAPSRYMVQPYVGVCRVVPKLIPDNKEVDKILQPALSSVFQPQNKGLFKVWASGANMTINAPGYRVGDHIIWGATAMMLSEVEGMFK
jgi:8-oxo-dGTP pyrophosphatase MutT (NUDIX family)